MVSNAIRFMKKPATLVVAAALVSMLGVAGAANADVPTAKLVNIPDAMAQLNPLSPLGIAGVGLGASANIVATTPSANPDGSTPVLDVAPITIDINGVASVDAQSISLVSVMARQIQLAKTPTGAKVVAKDLISSLGYDWNAHQVGCLNALWDGESHWNFQAHNYRSGAQGIAQALPPTKMEIVSTDWRTNPVTQIKWGLSYIKARYTTPCKALSHKHWAGYY
jgi:Transglycosylase SLT domain